jgi:cyclopropane fatty-acyl-phospholipid synthase-like methyltransferase
VLSTCEICKSEMKVYYNLTPFDSAPLDHSKVYRCLNCGSCITIPRNTLKLLESFYSDEYFCSDPAYNLKRSKMFASDYFRKLKKFFQMNYASSFLELGGGYGFFSHLVSGYWKIKVDMIELSRQGVSHANKNFKNVNVIEKSFDSSVANLEKQFDVVSSAHLLEHLVSPKLYFDYASKIVKDNGHILLLTPNANSLKYRIFRKYWGWACPHEHINFLSPKAVRLLAKEYGFEVDILKSTVPHFMHYPSVINSTFEIVNSMPHIIWTAVNSKILRRSQDVKKAISDRTNFGSAYQKSIATILKSLTLKVLHSFYNNKVLRVFSTVEYILLFPINLGLAKIGCADELLVVAKKGKSLE